MYDSPLLELQIRDRCCEHTRAIPSVVFWYVCVMEVHVGTVCWYHAISCCFIEVTYMAVPSIPPSLDIGDESNEEGEVQGRALAAI